MKIWKLNLYPEYFDKTKKGIRNWECRKDTKPYEVGDKLILKNTKTGETLERIITDVAKTNRVYLNTNLVILSLKEIDKNDLE